MKLRFILLLGMVLFPFTDTYGEEDKGAQFPSLISTLRISSPITFCDERVPVEAQDIRERLEKELLLALWDRPQVILWLKRSGRYLPFIEKMLREAHVPDDLKYIAIAESALRPHVCSQQGAIGFWQFVPYTGRQYGLRIDEYIDERRNLFASTRAAIRYLKDLCRAMGSWTLAAAAFNMGQDGVKAEVLEQGTDDYYELYLPIETQRYIFRIISAKLILSNPERYGFHLSQDDCYRPLRFDQISLNGAQDTPIRIIAQAARTHFKEIKNLNPEIRGHYLIKGTHTILIPKGSARDFHRRFQNLLRQWLAAKKQRVYIVKEGDNLSVIAERFNVPLAALLLWNNLDVRSPIYPGDRLVIYGDELRPSATNEEAPGEG
jgi:membrane-bound lytic murein transglycosylase D